jgi:hypothetical protein
MDGGGGVIRTRFPWLHSACSASQPDAILKTQHSNRQRAVGSFEIRTTNEIAANSDMDRITRNTSTKENDNQKPASLERESNRAKITLCMFGDGQSNVHTPSP